MTPASSPQLDLLVVGAGPAGLLTSVLASRLGLRHRVIERREGLHTEPSAHVLKTHTMEVYRRIGIADAIHRLGTPAGQQRYVTWCKSVAGPAYGRIDLLGKKGPVKRFLDVSPTYPANLPQTRLEPILLKQAFELGADVTFGSELIDIVDDGLSVTAKLRDGRTGATSTASARYLIGADGASSRVRKSIGIEMEGPSALAHFLAVNFRSDVRPLFGEHPGVLFFVVSPEINGTFIMHEPAGAQVFMTPYDPATKPASAYTSAECAQLVRTAFGCDHPFQIESIGHWTMSAQVARQYGKGRVFLVGDSAHRFPPSGGLGLNTGVEDVENLVWKLAAVVHGRAGASLLDSYEQECRPIALRNCQKSWTNNSRKAEVEDAIGVSADRTAYDAALAHLFGAGGGLHRENVETAVLDQTPHFASLEVEMAASYQTGAFLPLDAPLEPPGPSVEGYAPRIHPGAPLPHVWISETVSTLDLLGIDSFLLLIDEAERDFWSARIGSPAPDRMPVVVQAISGDVGHPISWSRFCGNERRAVLVRPDGRVAWVGTRQTAPSTIDDLIDSVTGVSREPTVAFSRVAPIAG